MRKVSPETFRGLEHIQKKISHLFVLVQQCFRSELRGNYNNLPQIDFIC